MNRWKKLVTVCMMAVLMAMSAVPVFAAVPASSPASELGISGVREFAQCVVQTHKNTVPEAKKLTPKGYQEFEKALNTAFKSTKRLKLSPHVAAVRAGAMIGKFIGYDFVWFVGVVQYCWPKL